MLIAATDGVLDNLFDQDLQACVSKHLDGLTGDDPHAAQESISKLAKEIAKQANAIGLRQDDPAVSTPFMQAAKEEGKERKPGGKLDDVAVVCGIARRGERPAPRLAHNFNGHPQMEHLQVEPPPSELANVPRKGELVSTAAGASAWHAGTSWGDHLVY